MIFVVNYNNLFENLTKNVMTDFSKCKVKSNSKYFSARAKKIKIKIVFSDKIFIIRSEKIKIFDMDKIFIK